ncbi:ChrR family anti-sigma-E factor [Motilimonas cestriensis]|uniref:ChrR family anti-sigma-E factor n=1 Tax=Motilimonas cestriensis TaxID=2742685 RepID=A0ABS8WEQ8_9GAMM|nr:ChrR family anti-sigma-E factor [Motilimonas cestriensis]MCE2596965.1 ChrR family anti-sigma-E factor [Motilimonas cestriensis]
MIKHHPESTMIQAFTAGELPASLSIAVSIHLELCPHCKAIAAKMTQALADEEFNEELELSSNDDFSAMMANITAEPVIPQPEPKNVASEIEVEEKTYTLPRALSRFADSKWSGLGNIQRARLPLEEGEVHASLLQIGEDSAIPHHTHKGYELTLLLDGYFEDESGRYEKGDFIILNGEHQHSPYTAEGCLCYTVSNAPLHFTSGVSKLLNPIGRFLY